MDNVNDIFFEGYYKDIWRTLIPEELTSKEVDFMIPFFKLGPDSKVLDLMCGYGRHALGLAKKGIPVTAVDNLPAYINEIKAIAEKEQLPVKPVAQNVIEYNSNDIYDLVICMGNSLNFFNADNTSKILATISSHLKPGGHLLINSWSIAEIAFKSFKEKTWGTVGELKFLTDSKILFHPTRMETESIVIAPDGTTEKKLGIDYIFSINELETMLKTAGLELQEVYSIPGKKKFTIGEPRAYIVVKKK
ncbi:MAG TPA: class I SAM-dependent methyltransferase [Chitinophagaceae bacterium]|nr:class I SAM-dependent methyltransferase [Chitinophagaceae bacterium]